MPRSARSSGLKSSRLGGSLRRDGDVLVINVDEVPSRRRAAALALVAVVAIGVLVWVGSALRGEDVTVMSSSITRSDPFTAETTSTAVPSTTEDPATTTPQPIDAVGTDTSVPPTQATDTTLPEVVAVEPVAPVDAASPTTTVKAPARKRRTTSPTTTAPEPLPPGFNLPAGFYLPPGYVATTAPPATIPEPAPVTEVTVP